jgi:hypothetical protein
MPFRSKFTSTCCRWPLSPWTAADPARVGLHRDTPARRVGAEELQHTRGHLVHIERPPLQRPVAQQLPRALDHLARAQIILADVGQDPPHLVKPPGARLQKQLGRIGVGQDRAEGLVDLMRDRGAQLAHHCETRRVGEPFVGLLRALAVGDVPPDSLQLRHAPVRAQNRIVHPVLPANGPIREQYFVLVCAHARIPHERGDIVQCRLAGRPDQLHELASDQRLRGRPKNRQ